MKEEIKKPTTGEMLARMIADTGNSKFTSLAKLTSVRVPLHDLSLIDAIAAKTDSSRQKVMVLLLRAGLEEVIDKMTEDDVRMIELRRSVILSNLMEEQGEELGLFDSEVK